MSDEAAFLEALKANPADDTARLVYADWLDEHDQPQKAGYLRAVVACAAAGGAVPDSLIDLAEPLPRDWRLAAAARFALAMEWRESGRKLHAIKIVRELTWSGLGEAKQLVEGAPDGAFFLMTAEDAEGVARHCHSEHFVVRSEVESLLGRRAPSVGTFAIGVGIGPTRTHGWDENGFVPEALLALRDFISVAHEVTPDRADELLAQNYFRHLELSHGHSLRQAHTEMSRLISFMPPDDSERDWKIILSLHPRVT